MKFRMLTVGTLAAIIGVGGTFGVLAQQPTAKPGAPVIVRPGRRSAEKHPELRRALRALMRAKQDLQNGARDFGGHRAKAEQLTEQAIAQVQQAINSDKK